MSGIDMPGKPTFRVAAVAATAVLFAACSLDTTDRSSAMGKFIAGTSETKKVNPDEFRPLGFCPTSKIRSGTQTFRVFQRGKEDDPSALRYQAGITETARECSQDSENLAIKVGVAGNLIAGPMGTAGTVRLPLRIAVLAPQEEVIYSKLHIVEAQMTEQANSVTWVQVDDQILVPLRTDIRVIVGFDYTEGNKIRN